MDQFWCVKASKGTSQGRGTHLILATFLEPKMPICTLKASKGIFGPNLASKLYFLCCFVWFLLIFAKKTLRQKCILTRLLTPGERRGAPSFHHACSILLTKKKGVGGDSALPSQSAHPRRRGWGVLDPTFACQKASAGHRASRRGPS